MAKIAFVQNFWYEYIGTMILSAFLKQHGHTTEVFVNDDAALLKKVKERVFDIIAFGIMSCHEKWMLRVATEIKKIDRNIPIIVGGPHPTFFHDVIEREPVDIICIGEGEHALLELLNAIDSKRDYSNIKNLWIKDNVKIYKNPLRNLIEDLDGLPHPDRSIYHKYDYFKTPEITVMIASRGCPYRCNFCFNHKWNELYEGKGKITRLRMPENIFKEVDYIKSLGIKPKVLYFVDSTFNLNKKWCLDFFKKYKGSVDIPFSCNYTAGLLDEEIIRAMSDTKLCKSIRFAVEVGNEKLRLEILRKNVKNEQIINAISLLKRYRIPIFVYNMFGVPTETIHNAKETIKINQMINPETVSNGLFMPYPGLSITEFALKNNIIAEDDLDKLTHPPYTRLRSILKQPGIKEVSNIHKLSILYIRYPVLSSLLNLLIKLPENKIFDFIYMLSTAMETIRYLKINYIKAIKEMLRHRKEMDIDKYKFICIIFFFFFFLNHQ
jgi:radical SAM superfamily enzyme YgiQ (UPF0313 family)